MKLLLKVIAAGFIFNFIFQIVALFFPPDMNQNPPVYQKPTLIFQSLGTVLIILSSTLLGLKLTEDKQTLAAGGFTMIAIAHALEIVTFYEFRHFTKEEYEKVYDIYAGFVALLIPACLLLLFYLDVPKWLRYLPMLFSIQQAIVIGIYYSGYTNYSMLDQFSFIGYELFNVITLLWGIYAWRQASSLK